MHVSYDVLLFTYGSALKGILEPRKWGNGNIVFCNHHNIFPHAIMTFEFYFSLIAQKELI